MTTHTEDGFEALSEEMVGRLDLLRADLEHRGIRQDLIAIAFLQFGITLLDQHTDINTTLHQVAEAVQSLVATDGTVVGSA